MTFKGTKLSGSVTVR